MILKGIPVSPGYAKGKVLILNELEIDYQKRIVDHPKDEIKRYKHAIETTKNQIISLIESTKTMTHPESAEILASHLALVLDPEVHQAVESRILEESCNLVYAIRSVADAYIKQFNEINDSYLKERMTDLIDVTERVIKNALHIDIVDLSFINEEVILVAKDLKPSVAAQINKTYIKGYVSSQGGKTSHSAIIAKLIGIPAVVGISKLFDHVIAGEDILIDGTKGEVITNYSNETKLMYDEKISALLLEKQSLTSYIHKKTKTLDDKPLPIFANIGSPHDLSYVLENGSEGIGLFRTELLYMDRLSMPTEDEQYEVYRHVLHKMNPKPVIIRTIDIGGDKHLPYFPLKFEENPMLGRRAIRLCLDEVEFFKVQLRALIRASVHGHLKIMFPMVATKNEFLDLKDVVLEVQAELFEKNISYASVDLGIMIEIPAAALTASSLAEVVDFFSIGTNDLIQYTMAADRNHEKLTYLYQPFNPAIIKLIHMVCEAAKQHNIEVGLCGEMASDATAVPLLIGLGINYLSVNPQSTLKLRKEISTYDTRETKRLASDALIANDQHEIIDLIDNYKDSLKK